jgi:hypothetical protein
MWVNQQVIVSGGGVTFGGSVGQFLDDACLLERGLMYYDGELATKTLLCHACVLTRP